jgi:hypothetical protein
LKEKSTFEHITNLFYYFIVIFWFFLFSCFFSVLYKGCSAYMVLSLPGRIVSAVWFSLEEDFVHYVWSSSLGKLRAPRCKCTVSLQRDSCFRKLSFDNWVDALVLAYLHHVFSWGISTSCRLHGRSNTAASSELLFNS